MMKLSRKRKTDLTGYLFIAPNLLGVLFLLALPVLFSLVISFTNWDYTTGLRGIHFNAGMNYVEMWKDDWFVRSLLNTFYFSIGTVPVSIIVSLIIAVMIDKYVINKMFAKVMFIMPYISNIVAVSIVWVMMLSDAGPVTLLVRALGVDDPPKWLGDYHWAMPSIIFMSVWLNIGFLILVYTAAMQSVPASLYESAEIDGANEFRKIMNITIPMLRPTTFFLTILTVINSFKVFGQVQVMTRGGPGDATNVLVYYIYTSAFSFFDMGYAASLSWILFLILFIVTLVQWQGQRKWAKDF